MTELYLAEMRRGPALEGTVDAAVDPTGTILGTAIWEGPTRRLHLLALIQQLFVYIRHIPIGSMPTVVTALWTFRRTRPKFPHWYLADIAVAAQARGLGVGSSLLRHRLAEADRAGLPVYLEATSARSQKLYERHGFRSITHIGLTRDGFPVAMLRSPAP